MARERFAAPTPTGDLVGWVDGAGQPVLLLHGGPGLSLHYLDEIAADIGAGYRIAGFQQRGVAPSTLDGPFDMATAIADVRVVLDQLGWERAWVVGHSWGGHLVLRLLAEHPERVHGVLAVEPIGVAGDGGVAAFEAELIARLPTAAGERVMAIEARELAGEATREESREGLDLLWPAYFADPAQATPPPRLDFSAAAFAGLDAAMKEGLDDVRARLKEISAPVGYLAGQGSPIPWGQGSQASAALSPAARVTVVPGAGHFPWLECPGCVRAALDRLVGADS